MEREREEDKRVIDDLRTRNGELVREKRIEGISEIRDESLTQ